MPAELDSGDSGCDYGGGTGGHWVLADIMRDMAEIGMRSKEVLKWLG